LKPTLIPLGFEVGSGEPVSVPLGHMAVTGQTQLSGKTTALEALITRSELRAVAFITKRGEGSFTTGREVAPFFQERADWEFVEAILESTMKQRMRFERAWVVRAAKGAKTLADVRENVRGLMTGAKRSMDQDIYMLLGEYLDKVVPLIARLPKSPRLDLQPGLNVMNLLPFPEELQMLVVASTLRQIHADEEGVVTLVPEAWKFAPQGRKTPVKPEAEKLIREGAGLRNFIWIDSQDMAGVEKLILRACSVWLVGVQREANELKRALDAIPAGVKKPKPAEVAQLDVGQFIACFGRSIHPTYVQPAWLDESTARSVARGAVPVGNVQMRKPQPSAREEPAPMTTEATPADMAGLQERLDNLTAVLLRVATALERGAAAPPSASGGRAAGKASSALPANLDELARAVAERLPKGGESPDVDAITRTVLERVALAASEGKLKVKVTEHEIEVSQKREIIKLDGSTLPGRIAMLLAEGFFDSPKGHRSVWDEVQRRGFKGSNNVQRELEKLAERGFLTKETGQGFRAVEGMKVNIIEE
jgi:hypothetical protein